MSPSFWRGVHFPRTNGACSSSASLGEVWFHAACVVHALSIWFYATEPVRRVELHRHQAPSLHLKEHVDEARGHVSNGMRARRYACSPCCSHAPSHSAAAHECACCVVMNAACWCLRTARRHFAGRRRRYCRRRRRHHRCRRRFPLQPPSPHCLCVPPPPHRH